MRRLPVATLLLAGALAAGCSATTSTTASTGTEQSRTTSSSSAGSSPSVDSTSSSTSASTPTSTTTPTATDSSEDLPDVSERLPYKGMPASLIGKTWLGPADEVGETLGSGKFKGSKPYKWYSRDGKRFLVFTAYVNDSEVLKVEKSGLKKSYWYDGTVAGRDLPDLYGTGEDATESTKKSVPDPDGWDDPDDYAEDCSEYFGSRAEACEYWCEEMGYEEK